MSKLYVGSEVGQLRRVLLNRPERALTTSRRQTVMSYCLMTYLL